MKRTILFLLGILISISSYCQPDSTRILHMEIGYGFQFNWQNEDLYFHFMNDSYAPYYEIMHGINLKFNLQFSRNMDIVLGSMAYMNLGHYLPSGYDPGSTNSWDYRLNGGGVYLGLNPHMGGKYFGIDAEIAAGILAFKEYRALFNNTVQPYVDKYDKKSSFLGGVTTLGFYLRSDYIGISPEIMVIMAGGSNGSFLFYGFNVPLTVSF